MIKKQYKPNKPYIKYIKIEKREEPSFELFKDVADIPLFGGKERKAEHRDTFYKIQLAIKTNYIKDNEERMAFMKNYRSIQDKFGGNYFGNGRTCFVFKDDIDFIEFYNKTHIFLSKEIENKNMQIIEFFKEWN